MTSARRKRAENRFEKKVLAGEIERGREMFSSNISREIYRVEGLTNRPYQEHNLYGEDRKGPL